MHWTDAPRERPRGGQRPGRAECTYNPPSRCHERRDEEEEGAVAVDELKKRTRAPRDRRSPQVAAARGRRCL
eukprot:12222790-Alexandrium_andersonii.AAC.1